MTSGSENWETYSDASEPEPDASEAYYTKVRAAQGKRLTPEGGYSPPRIGAGKKLKGVQVVGSGSGTQVVDETGRLVSAGTETGWTDEEGF